MLGLLAARVRRGDAAIFGAHFVDGVLACLAREQRRHHADGAAGADEGGEITLEGRDLGPEDIGAAGEHARDRGIDGRACRAIAGAGIGLRNGCRRHQR